MVALFKALSDETRLRIINILKDRPLCVCEIENLLGISQSNASKHLLRLVNADIIMSEKRAQWVYYRLSDKFIRENEDLYSELTKHFESESVFKQDFQSLTAFKQNESICDNRDN